MNAEIAISIPSVKSSESHSNKKKCPIRGSAKCASKSCPNAVTRVRNSSPKPMNTNQCPIPTAVHCSIRVCPRVSLSMLAQRAALSSLRPTAGWPILTVAMIERIARTNKAIPTTAMVRDTTMAKICMMLLSCRDGGVRSVGRVRHCVTGRALRVRPYLAVTLDAGSAAEDDAPAPGIGSEPLRDERLLLHGRAHVGNLPHGGQRYRWRSQVLVVEGRQQVADAVEPCGPLVVGRYDVPGSLLDVCVLEGGVLGHRVPHVELVLGEVHVRELPALQRLVVADLEASSLLLEADREPVLEHDDPRAHQHPFELGAAAQELLVLGLAAEAHHPLDVRAVVPAAVEQDHLPGGGKMLDVPLEVPLGALPLGGPGEGDDADQAGAGALGEGLDHAALPRRTAALEDDQHLEPLGLHPVLQQDELLLEAFALLLVDRQPQPAPSGVPLRVP